MKKNLFILAAAGIALASCSSDDLISENAAAKGGQPQEISLFAVTQPSTRAAVDGTGFDTETPMQVAAYDAVADRNFFAAKAFAKGANATWVSTPATYWPLSPTTINFLAYANLTAGSAAWNATTPASQVVLTMGDNSTAQNDLMFAIGTGTVVQNPDNTLAFPTSVPMVFKHAQAWLQFKVKAATSTVADVLTINRITLNSVSCQGVCTVTQTNYNATSEQSVAAAWTEYATYKGDIAAVNKTHFVFGTEYAEFANLMVIPDQGITSFTINYTLDEKAYDYTYTITDGTLAQANKYIYNINFNLHEIEIAPSIEDWTDAPEVNVEIPNSKTFAYAVDAVAGTYNVAKTEGTYVCTITGLTAGKTYELTEESAADWLTEDASVVADPNGKANISFTVTDNDGIVRNANIVLTQTDNADVKTKVTVRQAAGN